MLWQGDVVKWSRQWENKSWDVLLTPILRQLWMTRDTVFCQQLGLYFCCIMLVGPTHKSHQSKIKLHTAIKYDWLRLHCVAQHFCIYSEQTNCLSLGSYCIASHLECNFILDYKRIKFVFLSSQCNYFLYHESSFVNITKAAWKGKIINKRLC